MKTFIYETTIYSFLSCCVHQRFRTEHKQGYDAGWPDAAYEGAHYAIA